MHSEDQCIYLYSVVMIYLLDVLIMLLFLSISNTRLNILFALMFSSK